MIGFVVFGLVVGVGAKAAVRGRQELSNVMTVVLGLIGIGQCSGAPRRRVSG